MINTDSNPVRQYGKRMRQSAVSNSLQDVSTVTLVSVSMAKSDQVVTLSQKDVQKLDL